VGSKVQSWRTVGVLAHPPRGAGTVVQAAAAVASLRHQ
jgi:hypothetical protein